MRRKLNKQNKLKLASNFKAERLIIQIMCEKFPEDEKKVTNEYM